MNLIFLGAPGAGKGTQSSAIAEILNIPHISTGDIFRKNIKEKTLLGIEADKYISKGQLVPDEITISIVTDRLGEKDCETGFILDGFPRTIYQAEQLDRYLSKEDRKINHVVNIVIDEEELIDRLSKRRVCPKCDASFHIDFTPLKDNICLNCSAELVQREDDVPDVIKQRLKTYHEKTEPLIEFYRKQGKLLDVQGVPGIEKSLKNTLKVLGIQS